MKTNIPSIKTIMHHTIILSTRSQKNYSFIIFTLCQPNFPDVGSAAANQEWEIKAGVRDMKDGTR